MQGMTLGNQRRRRALAIASAAVVAAASLGLVALLTGASTTAGASSAAKPKAKSRPNIVVITSDDQTSEQMKSMKLTQRLIGKQGTTFNREYDNWPLCCPSRATHLTGQYAHNHGVLGNNPPNGGYRALDSTNTLPVWLDDAGYYTALVGKYLNGYGQGDKTEVPPGWDEFHGALPKPQRVYDYELNDNGKVNHYGVRPKDYKGHVFTRKALGAIDRGTRGKHPFFLWLTYTAPHGSGKNIQPNPSGDRCMRSSVPAPEDRNAFSKAKPPKPPSYNEKDVSDKPQKIQDLPRFTPKVKAKIRHDYRCRRAALKHVDRGVAAVIAKLRHKGELKNTVVMYDSDNGFFQGEHRVPKGKNRVYEEATRVPLLIRGPGFPKGQKVNTPTVNADIAPTVVKLAKAQPKVRRVLDGRPLMGIAQKPSVAADRTLLLEQTGAYAAVETKRYQYTEHDDAGEKELYDLRKDPFQLENRAGKPAYANVQQALATKLAQLRDCSGASCRN
ncbi:sulfatase [soil metagenome]